MSERDEVNDSVSAKMLRISEAAERWRRATAPAVEVRRQLERQMEPVRRAMRAAEPYQRKLRELTQRLQPFVLAMQQIERQWRPRLVEIAEGVRRFEEFHAGLLSRHGEEEIALPPFLNSFSLPDVWQLFSDPSKPALQVYQEYFKQEPNAEALLSDWESSGIYARRMPILRDAVKAHVEGRHTLSIPVLLAQIEGILCHRLGVDGHGKMKGKLATMFGRGSGDEHDAGEQLVARIITEEVFRSTKTERTGRYPNRHRVLHGHWVDYHQDEFASLRCILLLDALRLEGFGTSPTRATPR